MICPIRKQELPSTVLSNRVTHKDATCLESSCAFWDGEKACCAIKTFLLAPSQNAGQITSLLASLRKPTGER